ncbi:MAG: hypothetical protein ACR2HF_11360 [Methylococcaceae bacterium]
MGAIETLNNIRAALIDRVTLDAVGADGYPVFTQFRHNAQAAIKALSEAGGGVAVSALYHPEIGDIDLRWGQTSDDPRSKGMGLAKIIKWHPEVLHDLQGFISGLTVHQSHKKKGEIHLTDGMNARAGIKLEWNQKSAHWLVTAYVKKDTSVSKRTPAVLDGANGLTTASPNNAGDFIVGFEDIDVNTATLDSAMDAGIGVMARLKLVGELAKIKIGLKDAGDGPLAAMKRLKAISRANQIRVELGAAAKIPESAESMLVPTGRESKVKTAKGTKVMTGFAVVEATSLIVSHNADGSENPDYPQELQPRDRSRATSQAWVEVRGYFPPKPAMLGATEREGGFCET